MRHNEVVMNILLLFIFNIFTGALIYLILTLKIEKNSATFQEKKLKREMAEIIREFNSTAERNITILENHISSLKKLMNEHGSLKGVDFTILDNQLRNNSGKNAANDGSEIRNRKITNDTDKGAIKDKLKSLPENQNKMNTFIEKIHSFNVTDDTDNEKNELSYSGRKNNEKNSDGKIDLYSDEEITIEYKDEKPVDIVDLFQNTEDKYMLIAKLYNDGHSVEDLSKYSGLPSGEIKLVISLNS